MKNIINDTKKICRICGDELSQDAIDVDSDECEYCSEFRLDTVPCKEVKCPVCGEVNYIEAGALAMCMECDAPLFK